MNLESEKRKTVVFSCENAQEFSDLEMLMKELSDVKNYRVIYFNLSNVTGDVTKNNISGDYWFKEYRSVRLFSGNLKELPPIKKLITSVVNAIYLQYICIVNKANVVVIGVPLLIFRVFRVSNMSSVKLISFIRGIVAQSNENVSLSSKVFIKFGRRNNLLWVSRLLSDYYADQVICIGEVTKKFLLSRSVPEENINVIGSIYCDTKNGAIEPEGLKTIVFISSAFEWHGDNDAQVAQTKLVKNIHRYLSVNYPDDGYNFFVRPHPRENKKVYIDEDNSALKLDTTEDPVYGHPLDTLYISVVSNMVFELNVLGREARIIADEYFSMHLSEWCSSVGVKPIINWKDLIDKFILQDTYLEQKSLSAVISKKYSGRVVSEITEIISIV